MGYEGVTFREILIIPETGTHHVELSPGLKPFTLPEFTNMTIKHPPFEDVFPIENGGFSNVMLVFRV